MFGSRFTWLRYTLLATTAVGLWGCGITPAPAPANRAADGWTISREQIARSGAHNAWEALRRSGSHLLVRENSHSSQSRISHRGASSLVISPDVLVIVDGAHLLDWSYLREIPASTIAYIQILSARQGTVYYGTPAGNGVVVVQTDIPRQNL